MFEPQVVSEGAMLLRGRALALSGVLLWSITGVAVRTVEQAGALEIACLRAVALSVGLLVYLSWRHRSGVAAAVRGTGVSGVLAALFFALSSLLYIGALTRTSVANTLLLASTGPLFAALFAYLWLGERLRATTGLALLVAGAGVLVTVGGGEAGSRGGDLLALVAGTTFGAYVVALRRGGAVDMLPCLLLGGLATALLASAGMLVSGLAPVASASDVVVCVVLGVVQLGVGNILYLRAARYLGAAELTLLALGELMLAPVWVWLVYDERPELRTVLGGAIIVLALMLQCFGLPRWLRVGAPRGEKAST